MKKQIIGLTLGLALFGAALSAPAQTLYDNGPANGTIAGWVIGSGIAVADSFTLSADSTVAGATAALWSQSGGTLTSLDWAITTAPLGGTTLSSGTATSFSSTYFGSQFGGYYEVNYDSFSITPTDLAAGTYYFQLSDCITSEASTVFWDENNGPSIAVQTTTGSIESEAFLLYGFDGPGSVPEPTTLALAGLGGLWLLLFRRRK